MNHTTFAIIEGPYVLLPSRPSDVDVSTLCVLPCTSDRKIDIAEINRTAILELGLPITTVQDVSDVSLDTPQLPPHDAVVPFFGDSERRFIHIRASLLDCEAEVPLEDHFVPLHNIQTLLRSQEQHLASNTASQTHRVYPWPRWAQTAVSSASWDQGEDGRRCMDICDHRASRVFTDRMPWAPPLTSQIMFNFNAYWAKRWNSSTIAQCKAAGAGDVIHQATTSATPGRFSYTAFSRHDWVENMRPQFHRQVLLDDGLFGKETIQQNSEQ